MRNTTKCHFPGEKKKKIPLIGHEKKYFKENEFLVAKNV